jgi:hypothetical protein
MQTTEAPVLLTDAEVRQFIADGYMVLQPDLDPAVHQRIDDRFNWLAENEPNPGNNILPRLPELSQVLSCAVVRGAMISLLGEDYIVHPHAFWHGRMPTDEALSGNQVQEQVANGSHQDAYTPAAQGKSHCLQYLRFMYYSHDMALENGPTHIIPGTQYHADLTDEDRQRVAPVAGKAGTIFISHFDLGHSGCPNMSDRGRNMIKFIFLRARRSPAPTWQHVSETWKIPESLHVPYVLERCWQTHWRLLCGHGQDAQAVVDPSALLSALEDENDLKARIALIEKIGECRSPEGVEPLAASLNTSHQAQRTAAIYALAGIGEASISALVRILESSEKELPGRVWDHTITYDDACYALSAIGEPALDALLPLLKSEVTWTVLNAIHAINDIAIFRENHRLALESLLNHESLYVRMYTVNALGAIQSVKSIGTLLDVLDGPFKSCVDHQWPDEWALHCVTALAVSRLAEDAADFEDRIVGHLDHECGQVGYLMAETLRRIGTPSACTALVDNLIGHRWDASLTQKRSF